MLQLRPILSTLSRHRTASLLIVVEIALTCAIVCNAVFIIANRIDRLRFRSGVADAELVHLGTRSIGNDANDVAGTREDLVALRALPGVRKASVVMSIPFGNESRNTGITGLSFNDEGILTAVYSNGQSQDLAQIALAKFENPEAMFKVGNNRLKESRDSGSSALGAPGSNGRGKIFAKSLERSTVDLASEFVQMIQSQRAFQANAKTITTTDELLNEIIQLKR